MATTTDQIEAQRISLERGILQCIMENDDAFGRAKIRPDDFQNPWNKQIFETMSELEREGMRPNDLLLLHARLHPSAFEIINIITDGRNMYAYHPNGMPTYLKELRAFNKKNIVVDVVKSVGSADPVLVKQKIDEELDRQAELEDVIDDNSVLTDVFKDVERLYESENKLMGLSWGYAGLNHKTYGLCPGEVYVVAARPSIGKSMMAMNIAYNVAKCGGHVLINALEETKKNIYKRMISRITQIPLHSIMTGDIKEHEWGLILQSTDEISKLPLTIIDTPGLTGAQVSTNIARIHSKKKVDLAIVDHMQEVSDKGQNRHLAISEALGTMKNTIKKLSIQLLIVSQINRGVESRNPPRPVMSDLKESGDIEAKADMVMLLYRESYYKPTANNAIECIIAKSRNGMCGVVELDFNGKTMTIKERY